MEKKYKRVSAEFLVPESADIQTVIGSLWSLYKVDRTSEAIEDEPVLFIIEEIIKEIPKSPEEMVEIGTGKKETILNKLVGE